MKATIFFWLLVLVVIIAIFWFLTTQVHWTYWSRTLVAVICGLVIAAIAIREETSLDDW